MTDKDRRENDALEKLIFAAYDFSDEQLLAELEEAEAALSDDDFPGIEDRMFQKLKARMAEEEAAEADEIETDEEEREPIEIIKTSETELISESEEFEENPSVISVEVSKEEIPTAAPASEEKKVVRFGKRKLVVMGFLAAAFVGALCITSIGGKNYFFRGFRYQKEIVFDNDKNIRDISNLDKAYQDISNALTISVLKLEYVPKKMELFELEITESKAVLMFSYEDKTVYFIQEQRLESASVGRNTDRIVTTEVIENKWINKKIELEEEILDNGVRGYGISIFIDNANYQLIGQLPKEEFIEIVKNLRF